MKPGAMTPITGTPLNGTSGEGKLFIAPGRIEPYLPQISRLLELPRNRIYEYGEGWYEEPCCAEVEALEPYSGVETACCPRVFSWIIYYSHENTLTFAGSIVPEIRKILVSERAYWDRFEWED